MEKQEEDIYDAVLAYRKAHGYYNKKKIKVQFLFAWYDLWIGLFWDSKKRWLYILPIPMVGIIIKFA